METTPRQPQPSEDNRFLRTLLAFMLGILAGVLCAVIVFLISAQLGKASVDDDCFVARLEARATPPEPC